MRYSNPHKILMEESRILNYILKNLTSEFPPESRHLAHEISVCVLYGVLHVRANSLIIQFRKTRGIYLFSIFAQVNITNPKR